MEPFTLVERAVGSGPHHLFDNVVKLTSAPTADHDLQYIAALRENNPGMIVTSIPETNISLRVFADAGHATCELDTKTDSFASMRGYASPAKRADKGQLAEAISFAKYHYRWNNEDFILFCVAPYNQYVLKECRGGEHVLGTSKLTDQLILAIGDWEKSILNVVWVYDNWWTQSTSLYKQVMKSSWDDVILDESTKKELTSVTNKFFSSKQIYEDLGVPWKRGLLFHGPPGNGKTVSIRALMHSLYARDDPIPTLYVKDAPTTYDIGSVFRKARSMAPCMLILEDVETIVTSETRSYFFNEMDGLENNDGLFVVASTNFLDRLDPGLSKRPSRFDRKYLFPLPDESERILYCEYWRRKLKPNKNIEFPKKLCPPMAAITDGFSFAFMQECFVATLLVLARLDEDDEAKDVAGRGSKQNERKPKPFDGDNDDLDDYELWTTFREQAKILRKEVDSQKAKSSQLSQWLKADEQSTDGSLGQPSSRRSEQLVCRGHNEHIHKGKEPMRFERRSKDELLAELEWYERKQTYVNSASYEWRL